MSQVAVTELDLVGRFRANCEMACALGCPSLAIVSLLPERDFVRRTTSGLCESYRGVVSAGWMPRLAQMPRAK